MTNLGFVTGFVVSILVGVLLYRYRYIHHTDQNRYDERQKVERGKAYSYGYFTINVGVVLIIILQLVQIKIWLNIVGQLILVLIIALMVHVIYSILHDAYIGITSNIDKWIITDIILIIVNLICIFSAFHRNEIRLDGDISGGEMNIIIVLLLVVIIGVLYVKKRINEKEM